MCSCDYFGKSFVNLRIHNRNYTFTSRHVSICYVRQVTWRVVAYLLSKLVISWPSFVITVLVMSSGVVILRIAVISQSILVYPDPEEETSEFICTAYFIIDQWHLILLIRIQECVTRRVQRARICYLHINIHVYVCGGIWFWNENYTLNTSS